MIEMLIMDDDYKCYLNRFSIAFKGYVQFSAVDNRRKGVDLVKRTHYSAVILDHDMPHDGYEAAKEIRSFNPDVPLIGFSAKWNEEMANELNLTAYSKNESEIAHAVATLCGIDEGTYSKKIKPFFR